MMLGWYDDIGILTALGNTWWEMVQLTSVLLSQDNKILFWDVRKAAGPLCDLDQHNGGGMSHSASGEEPMGQLISTE